MKTHYSEADLLETYYMQPGESAPVMMHLASCPDCIAKFNRLEQKLREAAACPAQRPETFWSRQRLSIMRRIAAAPARIRAAAAGRVAAAALLVFLSGAAIVYHETKPTNPAPPITKPVERPPSVDEMHAPINPWESEEIAEFHEVVQWESWIADKGDGSSL